MKLPPGVNRRHRRATRRFQLALSFGVFDPKLSAKAAHYMIDSVERFKRNARLALNLREA